MSNEIEKLKLLDKVKESLYKQGGNIARVAKDLGLDEALVVKLRDKIQRKESFVVRDGITLHLIDLLCFNHLERTFHLREMLRYLEGKHEATVSACCEHIVVTKDGINVCLKCNNPTVTKVLDRFQIYDKRIEIIKTLKDEDSTLVDNAVKLKIPPKVDGGDQIIDRRTVVNIGNQTNQRISVSKEIEELDPLERDQLRRIIEQDIRQDTDLYGKKEEEPGTGSVG